MNDKVYIVERTLKNLCGGNKLPALEKLTDKDLTKIYLLATEIRKILYPDEKKPGFWARLVTRFTHDK